MLFRFSILVLVLVLASMSSLVVGSANISISDVFSIFAGGNVPAMESTIIFDKVDAITIMEFQLKRHLLN